jgi:hypothetical protein
MNTNLDPVVAPINWGRVVWGGLAAGLIVNAFEYGGHRVYLDDAWTASFRAPRKDSHRLVHLHPGQLLYRDSTGLVVRAPPTRIPASQAHL